MALRRFAGPGCYVGKMAPVRVAHLTDLHVGRVTPFAVQREAQTRVNGENPDLVLITGDFVCHSQLYLDQLTQRADRHRQFLRQHHLPRYHRQQLASGQRHSGDL